MKKTNPMTITEKILASHAGKKHVAPGDLVDTRIDFALGNDITAPLASLNNCLGRLFDEESKV